MASDVAENPFRKGEGKAVNVRPRHRNRHDFEGAYVERVFRYGQRRHYVERFRADGTFFIHERDDARLAILAGQDVRRPFRFVLRNLYDRADGKVEFFPSSAFEVVELVRIVVLDREDGRYRKEFRQVDGGIFAVRGAEIVDESSRNQQRFFLVFIPVPAVAVVVVSVVAMGAVGVMVVVVFVVSVRHACESVRQGYTSRDFTNSSENSEFL